MHKKWLKEQSLQWAWMHYAHTHTHARLCSRACNGCNGAAVEVNLLTCCHFTTLFYGYLLSLLPSLFLPLPLSPSLSLPTIVAACLCGKLVINACGLRLAVRKCFTPNNNNSSSLSALQMVAKVHNEAVKIYKKKIVKSRAAHLYEIFW